MQMAGSASGVQRKKQIAKKKGERECVMSCLLLLLALEKREEEKHVFLTAQRVCVSVNAFSRCLSIRDHRTLLQKCIP